MEINKNTLMWIVIGILVLAVVFLAYKVTIGKASATGNAIDTTGWSENEIMNYEMHGTIPARVSGGQAKSSGGMVGGC